MSNLSPLAELKLPDRDARYERWRWQIFFTSWVSYLGFYLTRRSFAIAKIELMKPSVAGWTKADLAWVDFAFLTTYAIGNILCGMLGDRFGARKLLLVGMLTSVVVAVLTGASHTVLLFGILYGIQGFAQSTGWSAAAKNLSAFFPQRERGRVIGWWCTSYAVGGVAGSALAGYMAQYYGWQYAFWTPAGALFGIWLMVLLLQRNRPEDVGLPSIEQYHGEPEAVVAPDETPAQEREGSWHVIREVLTNRMVLLLALVYFLVKMPRYMFFNWAPTYVDARLGDGTFKSGVLGSLYDIATPLAVLLGGYLSDKVFRSKRIPLSVMGLIGSAVLLFCFSRLPATHVGIGLGLFGIGLLLNIPDSLVSGTAAIDFGTKKGAATASGLINGCGSIGAILGGTLPGWIDKVTGGGDTWTYVFCGLGTALALAAVLLIPKWNALPPTASSDIPTRSQRDQSN